MKKFVLLMLLGSLAIMPAKAQFVDVDVTHPYFHSIAELYDFEIVKGYEANGQRFYRPRQSINRAEVLKILMLSAGVSVDSNAAQAYFPDVSDSDWFTPFVRTAASRKIVKGYADGRFYPESKVTRVEFLKMLIESFDIPYESGDDEEWFAPYLRVSQDLRLLPAGDEPHEHITRGEVAEIIFRANHLADADFDEKYTYRARGKASYYNEGFAGRPTANGEIYDPYAFTAAHRTLPFNTRIRVYNADGEFIVVRVNDRGPYHEDRVLDLSQRAFEQLAPISRGVLNVSFEVLSDPQDTNAPIPEQIRPNLSLESRNPTVPSALYENLRKRPTNENDPVETLTAPVTQPLFDETVPSLPTDFFPDVELRRFLPQRVAVGQVLLIGGRITDDRRPKVATIFLKDKATDEQQLFEDAVSGQNFEVPVAFYEPGEYEIGLVFDEERRSRVETIEVVALPKERRFAASNVQFASNLEVETLPEDQRLNLRWSTDDTRLSRLTFTQGNKIKKLIFENGINFFALPYDFLNQDFGPNTDLTISLDQAESIDGSWQKQTTNWKSVTEKSFGLWAGFPDYEKDGVLRISDFSRYYRNLGPIRLSGQVLDSRTRLGDDIYITDSHGNIRTFQPEFTSTRSFDFEFEATDYGRYVIEIVSDAGEILFNRAIYFSPVEVLPVLPKEYTDLKIGNKSGILHWVNTIRSVSRRSVLVSDPELDFVAQRYAERMANEDFIGHTAPDGETLQDRVKGLDFVNFGENLAYGSTLELALNGLEDSASHYKNIKSTTWNRLGIGLAKNAKGEFYVTQIFAKTD